MTDDIEQEFEREQAKRDRHISPQQRSEWADQLLQALGGSPDYVARNTPQACIAAQHRKLALLAQLAQQNDRE